MKRLLRAALAARGAILADAAVTPSAPSVPVRTSCSDQDGGAGGAASSRISSVIRSGSVKGT